MSWQQSLSLCYGDSALVGSSIYYYPGNYIDTLSGLNGCDSIVYTNITILPPNVWQQSFSICDGDSVFVGNNIYQSAGSYVDTLSYPNICDTIMHTNIYMDYNTFFYDTVVVNSSNYYWLNNILTVSGDYTDTLINSVGCDSIVNLNLTILNATMTVSLNERKKISRITNILGQETVFRKNIIVFYIFEDGKVEKRLFVE